MPSRGSWRGPSLAEANPLLKRLGLPRVRELAAYEWVDEGNYYREWLVPAETVNGHAKVRIVRDEELPGA